MNKRYDFCVLGAGLAGVSLAHELMKENATVCLIDPRKVGGGASGAPLGLVNPATGRYATKTWNAEKCLGFVKNNLEMVQAQTPVQFYKQTGVLRPALNSKIASRMKENSFQQNWPDGWIQWLSESEVKDLHPGITCTDGGVWLPVGMTVDIGTYLSSFTEQMLEAGLAICTGKKIAAISDAKNHTLSFEDGTKLVCNHLVFTTGVYSNRYEYWKKIKLHPVKGQLAILNMNDPVDFDHAVSALGYTSSLSPYRLMIGSTYEHSFNTEETDQQGLEYLLERFGKVLPQLKKDSRVEGQWAGVRASTPNRKPVLGSHPHNENLHIFAGLGSKGLLYSAYGAELLCKHIVQSKEIPAELSIDRFYS